MKAKRSPNIELLRCICMIMVITMHYCNAAMGGGFGFVGKGTWNEYFLKLLVAFSGVAVDCFVIITGYFLYKKTKVLIIKPIKILAIVIGYHFLFYLIGVMIGYMHFGIFSFLLNFLPNNYFATLYCTMFLLAPFMNLVISHLSKEAYTSFMLLIGFLFLAWPTLCDTLFLSLNLNLSGYSTVSAFGNDEGYTLVNFCVMYFIGAYLRKWFSFKRSAWFWAVLYVLTGSFIFLESLYLKGVNTYCNLFVVMSAVFLFLCFLNLDSVGDGGIFARIQVISKTTFSVFCISTNAIMLYVIWPKFQIQKYCEGNLAGLVLNVVIAVLGMYALCVIIDTICRFLIKPIQIWLENSKLGACGVSIETPKAL